MSLELCRPPASELFHKVQNPCERTQMHPGPSPGVRVDGDSMGRGSLVGIGVASCTSLAQVVRAILAAYLHLDQSTTFPLHWERDMNDLILAVLDYDLAVDQIR